MIQKMTFWISLFFIAGVVSCDNQQETTLESSSNENAKITIPNLSLPVKIHAVNFFQAADSMSFFIFKNQLKRDSLLFVGKISADRFNIFLKKKQGEQAPILYTADSKNKIIDTLILFERNCYVGIDSGYLPWIIINEELEILRTDTVYINNYNIMKGQGMVSVDTFIHIDRYQIDKSGRINKMSN